MYENKPLFEVQQEWLSDCLNTNKFSRFGQHHEFSSIKNIKDYQNRIPLQRYADYEPWIAEMAQGKADVLFTGAIVAFESTSGSTHGKKLIPYSERSLTDFRTAIIPWLKTIVSEYHLDSGSAYWALSPATRTQTYTPSGITIGMADMAYFGDDIGSFFKLTPVVPEWVGNIRDAGRWQLFTLYWLLIRHDLVFISVWSPTFFLNLIDAIDQHHTALSDLFLSGDTYDKIILEADVQAYDRLQEYKNKHDTVILWPGLKLVSCWSDASSASYSARLQKKLPQARFQGKGLIATEGVVTVPNQFGLPQLASESGFFEFINDDSIYLADELEKDKCYEVVITTSGGLYRYRTDDMVTCEAYHQGLPILRFNGRRGIQSDLVGEKLSEYFVSRCLSTLTGFKMLVPCSKGHPHYELLLDEAHTVDERSIEEQLEVKLNTNIQYGYARKIGQLGKLQLRVMKQPLEKYIQCMMEKGLRMGDIKVPSLSTDEDWLAALNEESI